MKILSFIKEEEDEYSLIAYIENVLEKEQKERLTYHLDNIEDLRSGMTSYNTKIPRLQKWYQNEGIYVS